MSDSDGRRGDGYCAVTVVCGDRQVDLALPMSVPCAALLPSVLRLVREGAGPPTVGPWALIPIGRPPLGMTDTLDEANVLPGDLLVLRQITASVPDFVAVGSVRDRLEELVDARSRTWTVAMSQRFSTWTTATLGGVMLVHLAGQLTGWRGAALAGTVSGVAAAVAVIAGRRQETAGAAACLTVACGWAVVAGWLSLGGPAVQSAALAVAFPSAGASASGVASSHAVASSSAVAAVAPGALAVVAGALLAAGALAAAVCMFSPAALVHAVALLVVAGAAALAAVASAYGATFLAVAGVLAAVATLAVGVTPRIALAVGGVRDGSPGGAQEFDTRFVRADRTLIGLTIGVAAVAAAGGLAAAQSPVPVGGPFAGVIGILLILRSRAFTQVPHLLGPRIGGVVVLTALWVGILSGRGDLDVVLVLGAAVTAAIVTVVAPAAAAARSAVVRARLGRALDLLERALVVVLVVLEAGLFGLFDAVAAVIA